MFALTPLSRTIEAAARDIVHRREQVRLSAVGDLARLRDPEHIDRAVALLDTALRRDASPVVRARAALALADLGSSAGVAGLCEAGADPDAKVRQMVVLALGELAPAGHRQALQVVREALESDLPALRFQALLALHRLLGEETESAIVEATRDADAQVAQLAYRLAEERWSSAAPPPEALLEHAREALRAREPGVALASALLLASLRDDAGRSVIVGAIERARDGVDVEDAAAAMSLAGERGWSEARPGLLRRARGLFGVRRDPLAWQARVALARLGDPWARESIARGLSAWSRDARNLAVAAVGAAGLEELRPLLLSMRADSSRAEPDAVSDALERLAEQRAEPADPPG